MYKKVLFVIFFIALLGVMLVGNTFAAGIGYWYNLIVPPFGGSVVTQNQLKEFNDRAAICSKQIGAGRELVIRLELANNQVVSQSQTISEWVTIYYPTDAKPADLVHTRISSRWYYLNGTQATGYWSPDTGCS
jgi:hypothetical protein